MYKCINNKCIYIHIDVNVYIHIYIYIYIYIVSAENRFLRELRAVDRRVLQYSIVSDMPFCSTSWAFLAPSMEDNMLTPKMSQTPRF